MNESLNPRDLAFAVRSLILQARAGSVFHNAVCGDVRALVDDLDRATVAGHFDLFLAPGVEFDLFVLRK